MDYRVGVEIALAGNVEKFLGMMSQRLFGVHNQVKDIEKNIGGWGRLIGGSLAAFGSYEVVKGLMHLADHGKELNHQQSMLLRNGIAYKDVIAETSKIYQKYTQMVPTASGPDFLRTANELVSVKGTLAGADQALVQSLKIEGLIGNSTGKSAEGQGYDFWRAVEDKGVIQNKDMTDKWLNAMTQGTIASGGKIGGADWYTYGRRAGTSWMGDSLDALPLQAMEMQTLTATGAGTARRTFANMVEGSQKLTKNQLAAWSKIGMLGKDHLPIDHVLEQTRPDLFIQETIDKLNAAGIKDFDAVKAWAAKAYNRKAGDFFLTAYAGMTEKDPMTGKTRLEKERDNLGRAQDLDKAYGTMMKTDYGANMEALNKQWNSFLEAAGGPMAKAAIPVLQNLTGFFQKLGAFANAHQDLTTMGAELTGVTAGLIGLSGAVTAVSGALKIAGFGAKGVPGGGIGPVQPGLVDAAKGGIKGGLIQGLLYYLGTSGIDKMDDALLPHLPAYKKGPADYDPKANRDMGVVDRMKQIWKELPSFVGAAHAEAAHKIPEKVTPAAKAAMAKIGSDMNAAIGALPGQVNPAIAGAFSSIGAALSSAISGLAGAASAAGRTTHVQLNLDGRKVADVVEHHIGNKYRAVNSASGHDGRADWQHPEYSYG